MFCVDVSCRVLQSAVTKTKMALTKLNQFLSYAFVSVI